MCYKFHIWRLLLLNKQIGAKVWKEANGDV